MKLGCHIGANKYNELVDIALDLNTNTFQIFSRSNRGGPLRKLDEKDIEKFNKKLNEHNFNKIVVHAPFVINGASDKESIVESSPKIIKEDIERIEMFKTNCFYVLHPGNHMGKGPDIACKMIADMLNKALVPEQKTILLLETMAGKGTEVGKTFDELKKIIDDVELKEKIGVCLDTCHIWDGGYDLNNLEDVLNEFDKVIGLKYLKVIHLNNSKNEVGSHKDRHDTINDGNISLDIFKKIINYSKLKDIVFILETPEDTYEKDLETLNKLKTQA